MPYNHELADRVRDYLSQREEYLIEEKKMFGGLAFMVNGKMCINVGDDQLMCRFDPELTEQLAEKPGYLPMIMKGKELPGYCYVDPIGYRTNIDFAFWLNLCLDYNATAVVAKKKVRK